MSRLVTAQTFLAGAGVAPLGLRPARPGLSDLFELAQDRPCVDRTEFALQLAQRGFRPFVPSTAEPADLHRQPPRDVDSNLPPAQRGNAEVGTVRHLQHRHTTPMDTPAARELALTSGTALLGDLQTRRPTHVFSEGLYENSPANSRGHIADAGRAQRVFAGWQPGQALNAEQRQMMAQYGPARLYAFMNPSVHLHATVDRATSDRHDAYVASCLRTGRMPDAAVVMDEREQGVMQRIRTFLQANPGADVSLVYGGQHNFARHRTAGFNPRVLEHNLVPYRPF